MRIVESFPHPIREIENLWIPLPDGCRLAARAWLPRDATTRPVPALIEYIPYRKRDRTRWRDEPMHRYFAGHGYAAVRIDVRGSGDSDGLLLDEYLEQEMEDAVQAIRWIASRSWCTGAVGMIGKSWGGINALQVAARRPPELGAVVTVCSTDDRYTDDAHYMGGALLNENLMWGSVLLTLNAQPPDPQIVGGRWRSMWMERLQRTPLFPEIWMRHPRRDDYWRGGSVCEDYGGIACPVYAVGGWADAYTNAIPRLLAGLRVPRKGLVGPWAHVYPHDGVPGPAIGFLQEALCWWDHWLKGIDAGIMDEPMYRVWVQEWVPPRSFYAARPGRWVSEASWPSDRITPLRRALTGDGLVPTAGAPERLVHRSAQTVGVSAGAWCPFGREGDLPGDQQDDDRASLVFDSEPLEDRLEILGAPVVTLSLDVDRPRGLLAVRLNDVAPDGSSLRVTYGLLDLAHRDGHERPELLRPGARYEVRVVLNHAAYAFRPRHRIRVAVSTAYWPIAWPAPEPVTLGLYTEGSCLELPVRPPRPEDAELQPFQRPEAASGPEWTDLDPEVARRTVSLDPETNQTICTVEIEGGDGGRPALSRVEAIDLEMGHSTLARYCIVEDDPLSAWSEIVHRTLSRRGDWSVAVETVIRLSSTRTAFRLEADLRTREGDRTVFRRRWDRTLPRPQV